MNRLTHLLFSIVLVMACIAFGRAQDIPIAFPAPPLQARYVEVAQSQESGIVVHRVGKDMGFQFVGAEPAISTQVVKGAPYSLDATVDTEQTLSDGNRIVHHQLVHVYRDSEGRTRREETLAAIGPWAASGTPPMVVTIQDPVSGATYSLDPQKKIATKLPSGFPGPVTLPATIHASRSGIGTGDSPEGAKSTATITAFSAGESGAGVVMIQNGEASSMAKPDETSESLGKETIAGVSAEGTRLTTTIPAEAMGNERPIEITRERWFSSDLQIVMRSKQTDPRFGVTTYEVTKLDRANPAHSLFEVPGDYQISKAPELPPLPPTLPK